MQTTQQKPLFPVQPQTWATLQKQPKKKIFTGMDIAAIVLAILAVSAIAYDQYTDARWNAEYQQQCDTQGC